MRHDNGEIGNFVRLYIGAFLEAIKFGVWYILILAYINSDYNTASNAMT